MTFLPRLGALAALTLLTACAASTPRTLPDHLQRRVDAHLGFLASDAMAGRDTATPSGDVAAQYVASVFKGIGLEPAGDDGGYLQRYPLLRTSLAGGELGLSFTGDGARDLIPGQEFVPRGYGATGFDVEGPVVFLGYGVADTDGSDPYSGVDVSGKVVMVLYGAPPAAEGEEPRTMQRGEQAERAEAAGAAGLLFAIPPADENGRRMMDWLKRGMSRGSITLGTLEDAEPAFPRAYVSAEGASALFAAAGRDFAEEVSGREADPYAAGWPLDGVSIDLTVPVDAEQQYAENAIGVLRGTGRPEEVVVVSAHMDHVGVDAEGRVFNGADDNASGTTAVMVAAQLLAEHGPLDRSVMFLAVSGEERGLLGSEWWVDHPTWPLEDVIADVNIDMVGRNAPGELGVTPSSEHPAYNSIVEAAMALGPEFGLDVGFESGEGDFRRMVDAYYSRSDHKNFSDAGIPVAFFFSGEHEDYHKITDTYDKIDLSKVGKVAALVGALVREVAEAPGRPQLLAKE